MGIADQNENKYDEQYQLVVSSNHRRKHRKLVITIAEDEYETQRCVQSICRRIGSFEILMYFELLHRSHRYIYSYMSIIMNQGMGRHHPDVDES